MVLLWDHIIPGDLGRSLNRNSSNGGIKNAAMQMVWEKGYFP